jgi:hypothetical protein
MLPQLIQCKIQEKNMKLRHREQGLWDPKTPAMMASAGSIAAHQSSMAVVPEAAQLETPQGPLRMRSLQELCDETTPILAPTDLDHLQDLEMCMFGAEEPSHHTEALKHKAWRVGMEDELKSIHENETWELTTLLAGVRPIGLKWVFKIKKDAAGNTIRHKARLVAKGYVQR